MDRALLHKALRSTPPPPPPAGPPPAEDRRHPPPVRHSPPRPPANQSPPRPPANQSPHRPPAHQSPPADRPTLPLRTGVDRFHGIAGATTVFVVAVLAATAWVEADDTASGDADTPELGDVDSDRIPSDESAASTGGVPGGTERDVERVPADVADGEDLWESGGAGSEGGTDEADGNAASDDGADRRRAHRSPKRRAGRPQKTKPEPDSPPESPEGKGPDGQRAKKLASEGTKALVRGRLPEAIRHFRDATDAQPRYAPARRGLGLANELLGRKQEARRTYERYLELAPDAPDAAVVRERIERLGGR